jgi:hypothetical protein
MPAQPLAAAASARMPMPERRGLTRRPPPLIAAAKSGVQVALASPSWDKQQQAPEQGAAYPQEPGAGGERHQLPLLRVRITSPQQAQRSDDGMMTEGGEEPSPQPHPSPTRIPMLTPGGYPAKAGPGSGTSPPRPVFSVSVDARSAPLGGGVWGEASRPLSCGSERGVAANGGTAVRSRIPLPHIDKQRQLSRLVAEENRREVGGGDHAGGCVCVCMVGGLNRRVGDDACELGKGIGEKGQKGGYVPQLFTQASHTPAHSLARSLNPPATFPLLPVRTPLQLSSCDVLAALEKECEGVPEREQWLASIIQGETGLRGGGVWGVRCAGLGRGVGGASVWCCQVLSGPFNRAL